MDRTELVEYVTLNELDTEKGVISKLKRKTSVLKKPGGGTVQVYKKKDGKTVRGKVFEILEQILTLGPEIKDTVNSISDFVKSSKEFLKPLKQKTNQEKTDKELDELEELIGPTKTKKAEPTDQTADEILDELDDILDPSIKIKKEEERITKLEQEEDKKLQLKKNKFQKKQIAKEELRIKNEIEKMITEDRNVGETRFVTNEQLVKHNPEKDQAQIFEELMDLDAQNSLIKQQLNGASLEDIKAEIKQENSILELLDVEEEQGSLSTMEIEDKRNKAQQKVKNDIDNVGEFLTEDDKTATGASESVDIGTDTLSPEEINDIVPPTEGSGVPQSPEGSESPEVSESEESGFNAMTGIKSTGSYEAVHKEALGLIFGSDTNPKWDETLFNARAKRFTKENITGFLQILLKESIDLVSKYSTDIFIQKVLYNSKSPTNLIVKENHEIVQCYFALKRGFPVNSGTNNVSVPLGSLINFGNKINNPSQESQGKSLKDVLEKEPQPQQNEIADPKEINFGIDRYKQLQIVEPPRTNRPGQAPVSLARAFKLRSSFNPDLNHEYKPKVFKLNIRTKI